MRNKILVFIFSVLSIIVILSYIPSFFSIISSTMFDWSSMSRLEVEAVDDYGTQYEGNIILYMYFKDNNGNEVCPKSWLNQFKSRIEIYTSVYDKDGKRIPDRLLYNKTQVIKGSPYLCDLNAREGHILIPRNQLGKIYKNDSRYGIAKVTIIFKNGKTLEDYAYLVRLKE